MRRLGYLVTALFSAAAVGAELTAAKEGPDSARSGADSMSALFACPSDPKTKPIGKIYGKNRGSTFCNDGAKASAVVGKTKLSFTGGVCWKSRESFNVGIGTAIAGKRRKADPPGFWLQDFKPGGLVGDLVDLGKGTLTWRGPVKVNRKQKTFSGKGVLLAGGKVTDTSASLKGSYACKRVLDAPDQ
jgi:hypothetical protein